MRVQILLLVCGIICVPIFAHAQVVITEIMYDLTQGPDGGREWIEVFNAGNSPVKLTDFRVVESGKSHKITAEAGDDFVAAGTYVVIADNAGKFKIDFPAYSGRLFDSAFSLSNSGETIGIADSGGKSIDSVSYNNSSANGTGDSLQRNPSSTLFAAGIPSPGEGIPATGLIKSPIKMAKTAKRSVGKNLPTTSPVDIIGESTSLSQETFVAAAASTQGYPIYWWLAPLLLATLGSAGIITARHYKKDEWDIVEEIEETS